MLYISEEFIRRFNSAIKSGSNYVEVPMGDQTGMVTKYILDSGYSIVDNKLSRDLTPTIFFKKSK